MTTKTELMARLNSEFPDHWKKVLRENPAVAWPEVSEFPRLMGVIVEDWSKPRGTSALFEAYFMRIGQLAYSVTGCYTTTFSGHEIYVDRVGGDVTVEREALKFLFNVLWDKELGHRSGLEYWQSLPD